METAEILIDINKSLSYIYNVLWWIAFWCFIIAVKSTTNEITIVNKENK